MSSRLLAMIVTVLVVVLSATPVRASLVEVLRQGLQAEGVPRAGIDATAKALSATIPQSFPLPAASAGFVYEYKPALGTFERLTTSLGPVFAERPQTLGRGGLNAALSYTFVDFDAVDGQDLRTLEVGGLVALTPEELTAGPATLPLVNTRVNLTVEAQILAPSFTYGVSNDVDINLTLPLVRTFLDLETSFVRVGELPVEVSDRGVISPGSPTLDPGPTPLAVASGSDDAIGLGDIALRAKYRFLKTDLLDAAGGLVLRLPTGDEDELQGTGDTELGVFLYAGKTYAGRIEPHLNLGVEFVTDDVDRSRFRYATGAALILAERLGPLKDLNVIIDFVGRTEFQRRADSPLFPLIDRDTPATGDPGQPVNFVRAPFLIDVQRSDVADFSVGTKIGLGRTTVVFFNIILPLNDDGFRSDLVPSGGLEYTF